MGTDLVEQDAGTGIIPFLPAQILPAQGAERKAWRLVKLFLVGPLLLVLRLPLILIVLLWTALMLLIQSIVRACDPIWAGLV